MTYTDYRATKDPTQLARIYAGKRIGRETFSFASRPRIAGRYSIVGRREAEGPLGRYFDAALENSLHGEESYERAESAMFVEALDGAMAKAGLNETDVDALIGGDLLDQIVSTNYAARCFHVPFFGVYNACATSCEALTLAAMMIDGGFCDRVACCTGSHFGAAERQYRGPCELGCQKAPYSQWTVTAAGACVLSATGSGASLTQATVGKVVDYGVEDATNMSAAMAPAMYDTLKTHLKNTRTTPADYDLIVSGDLGKLGEDILRKLMRDDGIEVANYIDCGHMIYGLDQRMQQGGSGAGCSISVLNAYFLPRIERGDFKKILFIATGALMSTTINQQGETIPAIAHAIVLEAN